MFEMLSAFTAGAGGAAAAASTVFVPFFIFSFFHLSVLFLEHTDPTEDMKLLFGTHDEEHHLGSSSVFKSPSKQFSLS